MSEIIRAYELKRGDLFIKQSVNYLVQKVTDTHIIYSNYSETYQGGSGQYCTIGRWSQERIEYLGQKPKKKKTKPFKEKFIINK
jgi:hypothetical protein